MQSRRAVSILALGVIAVVFSAVLVQAAQAAEKDIPDVTKDMDVTALVPLLEKGTIVLIHEARKNEPQFTTGIVLINAPLAKVWTTVTLYDKYPEFVPNADVVKVAAKPREDVWNVDYALAFDILWPISFSIDYTLEQHFIPGEKIWGYPPEGAEGAFKDVRFLESFIPVDEGRTIFTYTTFTDLKSFSWLGKIMLNKFPELQTPTLIAVCFLFPECIKERVEGVKLVSGAAEIKPDQVVVPEIASLLDVKKMVPILRRYRLVESSFPDKSGGRFVNGLSVFNRPAEEVYRDAVDFDSFPKYIPFVKKAAKSPVVGGKWTVDYEEEIEIVKTISIEFRQMCVSEGPTRYSWKMDPEADHDVDGDWGRVEVVPVDRKTSVFTSTQLSDMGSTSWFLSLMTNKIKGFDMGLRVAMADLFLSKFNDMILKRESEARAVAAKPPAAEETKDREGEAAREGQGEAMPPGPQPTVDAPAGPSASPTAPTKRPAATPRPE